MRFTSLVFTPWTQNSVSVTHPSIIVKVSVLFLLEYFWFILGNTENRFLWAFKVCVLLIDLIGRSLERSFHFDALQSTVTSVISDWMPHRLWGAEEAKDFSSLISTQTYFCQRASLKVLPPQISKHTSSRTYLWLLFYSLLLFPAFLLCFFFNQRQILRAPWNLKYHPLPPTRLWTDQGTEISKHGIEAEYGDGGRNCHEGKNSS